MPEKLRLTLQFLGILFPYIFFLAHVALSMGMLHCRNHFFTPAMSPVVLNIIWLAAVVFVCPFGKTLEAKAFLLAGCILFSGVIQFAIQLFPLYRFGYRLKLVFDFFHPALKKMARLMGPAILTFAVTQISVLLDMTFAFFLGDGANASLYYGNRLMQFPLGLFGIAVGTVLLPTFSNQAANFGELRQTLSFSLRSVFFIIVPASVGLIFLRDPIVRVLFERGNFDEVSTIRTATTLMCYSFGLFAYAGQKAVTSTFYALQDSKTPFLISGFSLGLDLILNLILMWPLKEAGLALSTSIGGIVDFLLLFYLLEKKIEKLERESIIASLARITAASLVMGIGAWLAYRHAPLPFSSGLLSEIFRLACGIASGILLYLVSAYFFRVNELHGILKALRR